MSTGASSQTVIARSFSSSRVPVKTKDQVKEAWDYEEITKTVPAAQAYAAPDGSCKLS